MNRFDTSSRWAETFPELQVHVLSEHVFCPRAGLLARGAGDEPDEEPRWSPRLDGFFDYDAQRFAAALRAAWSDIIYWLAWLAPALLIVLAGWRFWSALVGVYLAFPFFYLSARLVDAAGWLMKLVREERRFAAALPFPVGSFPENIQDIDWWSLRKAGFDCRRPHDPHYDAEARLAGKPWRILTYQNAVRIPVVRKHQGERTWGPQHVVRLAAYCRLLERCEGATSPFGVLLFADSKVGILFPHTAGAQFELEQALIAARSLFATIDTQPVVPTAPTDQRCAGCPWGQSTAASRR